MNLTFDSVMVLEEAFLKYSFLDRAESLLNIPQAGAHAVERIAAPDSPLTCVPLCHVTSQ